MLSNQILTVLRQRTEPVLVKNNWIGMHLLNTMSKQNKQ